jgi:WD40 repeat protein
VTAVAPPTPRVVVPATPYVGLTPFTEGDAPFFFGREKERRIIAANLLASRLTLLYGASGVGKSSIIRAGIQRDFRTRAEEALAAGAFPESIVVVFTGWRDDPIAGLAECISASVRELLGKLAPRPPRKTLRLDDLFVEWNRRLDEKALEHAGAKADLDEPIRTELLVVFDQFEQYFVYHDDEDGPGTFAVEFPRALNRDDLRASFLISLREDAYTQLDRFEGRILNLFTSNLRIEHLDEKAATAAIVKPVEKYNELLGNGDPPYEVEPELVKAVITDVQAGNIVFGQAGGGVVEHAEPEQTRVETPFLQLVMSRLWEEEERRDSHVLKLATLRDLGGAERIVRRHLDEAMSALDDDERAVAARMLHQLVTPSGTRIVHSALDLAGYAEVSPEVAEPILEKLDERRILRTIDPAPGEKTPRFEIRHDVLAGAVVEWSRKYDEQRRHQEEEARRLQQLEEDRRRQRTRLAMRLSGGALAGFLIAVALALLAWTARNDARGQEHKSQSKEFAFKAMLKTADDPTGSVELAMDARKKDPHGQEADGALRSALVQAPRAVLAQPGTANNELFSAAFSPDEKQVLTGGANGKALMWRAGAAKEVGPRVKNPAPILSVAFSNDGRRIVIAHADGTAQVVDTVTGRPVGRPLQSAGAVSSAAFSPDGRRVLTASVDGTARFWDATTGAPLGPPIRVGGAASFAAYSPDGKRIVTADSGTAKVWEVAGRRLLQTLSVGGSVLSVAFSPDGRSIVTAGTDPTPQVWDAATGRRLLVLRGHDKPVRSAAFSPDGGQIVTASEDRTGRVWDATTGQQVLVLHGHKGTVDDAAFSADGRRIVTVGADGVARVWTAPGRSSVRVLRGVQTEPVDSVAFSSDGKLVEAANIGGRVFVWRSETGRRVATLPLDEPFQLGAASFSPDGRLIVTAGDDPTARVWDAATGGLVGLLKGHSSSISDAAFSPTGDRIVTSSDDGTARVWETASRRQILVLRPSVGTVRAASFSPNGKRIVTGGEDGAGDGGAARIWDASSGRLLTTLRGHEGVITSAVFSPDGSLVLTGSADQTARVWEASTGEVVLVLRGHTGTVNDAVFSSDGTLVATTSDDGTARVWDGTTGVTLAILYGRGEPLYGASFSPDDRTMAVGVVDGSTRLYACDVCAPLPDVHPLGKWPPLGAR